MISFPRLASEELSDPTHETIEAGLRYSLRIRAQSTRIASERPSSCRGQSDTSAQVENSVLASLCIFVPLRLDTRARYLLI
jgi:hypothetical protein